MPMPLDLGGEEGLNSRSGILGEIPTPIVTLRALGCASSWRDIDNQFGGRSVTGCSIHAIHHRLIIPAAVGPDLQDRWGSRCNPRRNDT